MFLPSLLFLINILKYLLCCFLLLFVLFVCNRFDGDSVENNPEAVMDKSKPWSRSIEDLHGGNTLQSPITGNGITRAGRHSTLRYGGHTGCWLRQKDSIRLVCLCGLWLLTADFAPQPLRTCAPLFLSVKPEHCDYIVIIFQQSPNSYSSSHDAAVLCGHVACKILNGL